MTSPETTVTLTLEKPGDKPGAQYRAKVFIKHDFNSYSDDHAHERMVDTPEEAAEWARGIMRLAGADSLRVLNKTNEDIRKAVWKH